jgi:AcrR family transcriptional regulator
MTSLTPVPTPPASTDQRTAIILDSVRTTFAEKGFDGASMQDLARQAGMSVGNLYRYFPSKSAFVEALIARDMEDLTRDFHAILGHERPLVALRETIWERIAGAHCAADGQLWAEITAAALRKPEIGAAARRMEEELVNYLTTVFSRATGCTPEVAAQKWSAQAMLIVMLVKASAMNRPDAPERDALRHLVMQTIDRTLNDISQSA